MSPQAVLTDRSTAPTEQSTAAVRRVYRRPLLVRLLAMGTGVAIACGIAEVGLRIAGIGIPHLHTPDPYCGSRLRPSTTGVWTREGHGNISINALGFRGPELPATKGPRELRIAVLGDSFIEALQVDEDKSFCSLLQGLLASESDARQRTCEVINCGVSGYGTAQELQMLRHYVLPLAPDAVLLAVFPENDICNNLRSLEGDPARPYFTISTGGDLVLDASFRSSMPYLTACSWYERQKAAVVNSSRVLQILKHAKQTLFRQTQIKVPQSAEEDFCASVREANCVYAPPIDDEHQQAWHITERLIQEVAKDCHAAHIPLVVFTVSSPVQVYPDRALRRRVEARYNIGDLFYSERRIQAVCERSDITFVPLASQLQTAADESGEFFHGFANTCLGQGHWNESGHLAAARILANWLLQDGRFTSRDNGIEE